MIKKAVNNNEIFTGTIVFWFYNSNYKYNSHFHYLHVQIESEEIVKVVNTISKKYKGTYYEKIKVTEVDLLNLGDTNCNCMFKLQGGFIEYDRINYLLQTNQELKPVWTKNIF